MTTLFRSMAADLSGVLPMKQNVILCPLCLEEFGEHDINPDTLSEEHVIPQSAGGKLTTITCKKCNNTAGTDLESHFSRAFRIERARRGEGEITGKLKMRGGVSAPTRTTFTEQGLHINVDPKSPYAANDLLQRFRQYAAGEREATFTLDSNVDGVKLSAAIVKMAYLALFKDWGYKYALLPNRDWVRHGIRFGGEEREWLARLVIPANLTDKGDLPEAPTRISFETNCNGISVACCFINAFPGVGSVWVVLPPMFDMNVGHHLGLERAAEYLLGKSFTIKFEEGKLPVLKVN